MTPNNLNRHLLKIEESLGGTGEWPPAELEDKLNWHLCKIEELINGGGGGGKISFVIVDKLPDTGEEGIVYLVPKKTIFAKNKYDEYVWIEDDFEYIGTGAFDPTGYATVEYVDEKLLEKQDKLVFNGEVPTGEGITITSIKDGDNYYVIPASGSTVDWSDIANKPEFAEVSFSGSYNDLENKPDLFEVPVFELEEFDPEEGIMELSQSDLADIYTNKYELVYLHLNYEDEEEHFSYEFNLLFKLASAITVNNDLVLQYDFYSVDDEKEEDRAVLDHISFKLGYDSEDHEYKTEVMEIYVDPEPTVTWDAVTNKPEFASVATSGSYTDLNDTPTNVSAFTNDAGYVTTSYHDSSKQDTLVSGTNIKTINGESLLGSGNLDRRTITLLVDQETGDITMSQDDIDYLYTYRPSDVYVITPVAEGITATQVYELVGSTVVADYDVDSLVYKTLDITDSEFVTSTVVAIPHNASDPVVPVEQELALHSDIPAAVSGTNDGTNWTSLTIGSTTKAIPNGVTDVQVDGGTSIVSSGIATIPALYSHYITFMNSDSSTYVCVNLISQVASFTITTFIQYINQMFETGAALAVIPASGTIRISATSHRIAVGIKPGSSGTQIKVVPAGAADSGVAEDVVLEEGSGTAAITSLNDVITRIL